MKRDRQSSQHRRIKKASAQPLQQENSSNRYASSSEQTAESNALNAVLNAEVEQRVAERIEALRLANEELLKSQMSRERLIGAIAQQVRQSLNLDEVLATTVAEVRQFLQADRVLIYRFEADWSGIIAVESVAAPWTGILGRTVRDSYFVEEYAERYKQGRLQVVEDIYTANLTPCHLDLLASFQVRASLIVPIVREDKLWGLLIAHQCSRQRQWQQTEIDLLKQLAAQVGSAIQQAQLFQQVQRLNVNLEGQVQVRTAQLHQSLNFEARLKRITDKVRDSLDETQILQTAVQELALGLGIECCDAGLYDSDQTTSTIRYEYTTSLPPAQGKVVQMSDFSEHYRQLIQGQHLQFCPTVSNSIRPLCLQNAILACPIVDDQKVMGDLWLFKQRDEAFNDLEVRLVQQVANQCAIALRQARLYQAAQAQVEELEKLNRLKDDFLSTVSHELRTPMSNIKMAIQMLEIALKDKSETEKPEASLIPADRKHEALHSLPLNSRAAQYFQILQNECQREISLINDLLDLSKLDAEASPLMLTTIDLNDWIPHIVQSFEERAHSQQQSLQVDLPADLPALTTDLPTLERILTELLNNACKYTPVGENIRLAVTSKPDQFQLEVSNSGIEIPAVERDRVFEKFYRVPSSDPWKHTGTGLGLALVKKLVERLQGRIEVASDFGWVSFKVKLPKKE